MKTKHIVAAALAGTMLLCAACGQQEQTGEEVPSGTAVEVVEVSAGPMSARHSLTGTVAAVNAVQVFPLLAGQVLTLSVEEGDTVHQGQTLLTVDTSTVTSTMGALRESYNATKTATDSAVASARLGVEQARLGVEQAQQAVENAEALLEVGAAAEQDVTQAHQGLQQAQAALSQAEAGVTQAEAQRSASLAQIQASMDQITTQAELGTVTAPCAGTVTAVNVVRGGMASSAQPAVVIAESGRVEVQTAVAEDVFVGLSEGDTVDVMISVLSDEPVEGEIAGLPVAANVQTGLYDVSVSLPADAEPPIGAFATVIFYTDRRDNTLSVPTEAVLTGADNEQYVFVVDSYAEGDTAVRIPVETGLVSDTHTEIVSGLAQGDRVVIRGQSYLSDGALVRIVSGEDSLLADTEQPAASDTAPAEEG
nr:efflux RND transporter periplasmic adaptor subunit [uncultured Agathobaculum sp.]